MVVRMNNQPALFAIPTRLRVVLPEGYVFTIKIRKIVAEAGQPLQGAVFEVIRDRSKAVVGRLTTILMVTLV